MSNVVASFLRDRATSKQMPMLSNIDGTPKQWSRVNQTGTQAVIGSLNTSSIVDGGAGVTTINLTALMADSESAVSGSAINAGTAYAAVGVPSITPAAYQCGCYTAWGVTTVDVNGCHTALHGRLA